MFKYLVLIPLLLQTACSSLSPNGECQKMEKKYVGEGQMSVDVIQYTHKSPAYKALMVFAPTGRSNYIDRQYAEQFCKSEYDVYILNGWTGDDEENYDLELHQRLYTRAQKALDVVLKEVRSTKIGLLGTSVGALHAAVTAQTNDRVSAIFMITGGAPIADIIVKSDQKAMRMLKEERHKRYGIKNDEEYIAALNKAFKLEPLSLGEKYKTKKIGMAIATNDPTVPTDFQFKLRDAWKPKKEIEYDSSHFWTIVKTWYYDSDKLVKFFDENL